MNAGKIIFLTLSLLILVWGITACVPSPTPQLPQSDIEIVNIIDRDLLVGQIVQKKVFDQCQSDSPLNAVIQFSETARQTGQKALTISGSGAAGLDKLVELKIEGAVQEYFLVSKEEGRETVESISIVVPAHTHQEYTIIWEETRHTGIVEYVEGGEQKSVDFSYRTGVGLASSSVKNIGCVSPTETRDSTLTPIPTFTPVPTATPKPKTIAENCIHTLVWKPASTDTTALRDISIRADGCYSTEVLGIFTDNNGILHLNYRDQRTAVASGIYTPIEDNSVIEFKIFVNSMYIVYPENPVIVNFAVASLDDVLISRKSARFKLQVETNGNRPIVHFVLADVGENNGTPIGNQHYEYGRTYTIRLELMGNVMRVYINGLEMNEELLIPTEPKVFYIGYNIPVIAGVDVEIKDIVVDGIPK